MKRRVIPVVGALACGLGACGPAPAPGSQAVSTVEAAAGAAQDDGFEEILGQRDGRYSKHGWNHYGPGHFDLDPESGVLTSHGGMGLFWYAAREYADFVLELEFRCQDERTNSGVFVRVPAVPVSDDYIYHSFEIQIDETGEGIHGTGAVYDAEAPASRAARQPGEWNHYRIAFIGDRITVDLNGTRVVDWRAEPRGKVADFAPRGYIGLQNHDDRSAVYFRRIRVKEVREDRGEIPEPWTAMPSPLSRQGGERPSITAEEGPNAWMDRPEGRLLLPVARLEESRRRLPA